jgi:trans-aconitate methyltransferase
VPKHSPFQNYEALATYFNNRVKNFGASTQALQWKSRQSQRIRFDVIYNELLASCKSIVDIGCGCGDFYDFLLEKNDPLHVSYKGIDISAQMICAAQKAYPSGTFMCLDINDILANHKPDTVIASGLFNLRLHNHQNHVYDTLSKLIQLADKQIIINFLSESKPKQKDTDPFVYFNTQEIVNYFSEKVKSIKVINQYLDNDTTLVFFK